MKVTNTNCITFSFVDNVLLNIYIYSLIIVKWLNNPREHKTFSVLYEAIFTYQHNERNLFSIGMLYNILVCVSTSLSYITVYVRISISRFNDDRYVRKHDDIVEQSRKRPKGHWHSNITLCFHFGDDCCWRYTLTNIFFK